ncbi:hypothetical protein [Pseudofrankia asymbiotica]|uniref:Uncharacterized protein n=1 Tax=Pseudofrankia asymbiotica TaxID=1834516 RepID=A0A1V2I2X5_9ACTN|nr:hypothetical protein [Pseudofrankia asymbiotica]ONH23080.1 hypothetical protein BL253_33900 [Pseudofrankia asymbiotica]
MSISQSVWFRVRDGWPGQHTRLARDRLARDRLARDRLDRDWDGELSVATTVTLTLTGTGVPFPAPGRAGAGTLVRSGDTILQFDEENFATDVRGGGRSGRVTVGRDLMTFSIGETAS